MGREIKFRGRDVETGEYVYAEFEVKPESVEQFIAKDANGHDVYEGDTVCWANAISAPFLATFDHYYFIRTGEIIYEGN